MGFRAIVTLTGCLVAVFAVPSAFGQKGRNDGKGKPSSLESSKKVKFKDKTEVNFDDANIEGSVKNPFGTIVNSRDQDINKGFIKLRYHWHDQMVMSVSGLSQ